MPMPCTAFIYFGGELEQTVAKYFFMYAGQEPSCIGTRTSLFNPDIENAPRNDEAYYNELYNPSAEEKAFVSLSGELS